MRFNASPVQGQCHASSIAGITRPTAGGALRETFRTAVQRFGRDLVRLIMSVMFHIEVVGQ
jgi:hypothetical protein